MLPDTLPYLLQKSASRTQRAKRALRHGRKTTDGSPGLIRSQGYRPGSCVPMQDPNRFRPRSICSRLPQAASADLQSEKRTVLLLLVELDSIDNCAPPRFEILGLCLRDFVFRSVKRGTKPELTACQNSNPSQDVPKTRPKSTKKYFI